MLSSQFIWVDRLHQFEKKTSIVKSKLPSAQERLVQSFSKNFLDELILDNLACIKLFDPRKCFIRQKRYIELEA